MSSKFPPQDIVIRGIPVSPVFGAFVLAGIRANEPKQAGLGYSAEYFGDGLGKAAIYIYDHQLPDIPDGTASELVLSEFSKAGHDIMNVLGGQLVSRSVVATVVRKDAFLGAEFIVETDGGPCNTFLFLTATRGSFLKIRLTLKPDIQTYDPMGAFVEAVAARLWAS